MLAKIAICPGSYDPITNGHIDVIERASKMFDKVIVAVALNPAKNTMLTVELRVDLVTIALKKFKNVEVLPLNTLLVEFAKKNKANVIIKGLRAVSDFDHEFQMAQYNRDLNPKIETIFIMSHYKYMYLSSSLVKDIAENGGSVNSLVPPEVEKELKNIFKSGR